VAGVSTLIKNPHRKDARDAKKKKKDSPRRHRGPREEKKMALNVFCDDWKDHPLLALLRTWKRL
jgi:hypothetical protein